MGWEEGVNVSLSWGPLASKEENAIHKVKFICLNLCSFEINLVPFDFAEISSNL